MQTVWAPGRGGGEGARGSLSAAGIDPTDPRMTPRKALHSSSAPPPPRPPCSPSGHAPQINDHFPVVGGGGRWGG